MKTIIAGSRDINIYGTLLDAIEASEFEITEVLSGRANGVDKLGELWATLARVPISYYPADWDTYGKSAGYRRNAEMVKDAEALIAVWDGESRGTKHTIELAKKKGIPVYIERV